MRYKSSSLLYTLLIAALSSPCLHLLAVQPPVHSPSLQLYNYLPINTMEAALMVLKVSFVLRMLIYTSFPFMLNILMNPVLSWFKSCFFA